MTTIISNRSIRGMHAFPGGATRACWGAQEKEFLCCCAVGLLVLCVCVCCFFTIESLLPFFFFIALKCYFQQLLSYKYLLFFFSSFPPGEKGRGPIENSALSLSGEFKCGSNNRFLLLFFFKFPVVLLPRSALKENRKGSLECARLYSQRQNARLRLCEHTQDFIRTQTRTHTHTRMFGPACLCAPNTAAFLQDTYFRDGNKAGKWEKFGSTARFQARLLTLPNILPQELQKL